MISLSIIGNLGKDATVNQVNGKNVINFSVCHTQKMKDGTQKSIWIEAAKWGETTAIAPYLLKGTKVFVEGVPDLNIYDKKDGGTGASIRVMVNKIELLGGNKGEAGAEQPAQTIQAAPPPAPEPLEELPF